MRTRARLVAVVLCAASVLACRSGERLPEQPGVDPAAAAPPSRIVSLVPAVTEILFAIGAGNRVAGVSSFDRFPPEVTALPTVGALLDPDLERIAALAPDLVVLYATQADLRAQVERMGIAVYEYRHAGLPDVTRTIRELGARLDVPSRAEAVAAGLEARLAAIRSRVAGRMRPRTLLVFGREPGTLRNVLASGGVGFLADLLEVAGGENVFADVHRESVPATIEALLATAPDVIIKLLPRASDLHLAREAERSWRAMPALPAVAAGRVHVLVGDQYVVPGPRLAAAAEEFARALHPAERMPQP